MKKEIKFWKPNIIQRFLYWIKAVKDPRFNGKKFPRHIHGEVEKFTVPKYDGVDFEITFVDESRYGSLANLSDDRRAKLFKEAQSCFRLNKKAPN